MDMSIARCVSLPATAAALFVSLAAAAASASPRVENLGHLRPASGETRMSQGQAVTDDGEVVAGYSLLIVDGMLVEQTAFRWSRRDGMQALPRLPGGNSTAALALSSDGRTVVGLSNGQTGGSAAKFNSHATRWRVGEPPLDLGTLPGGDESAATGISGNGMDIVGYGTNAAGHLRATRWHQTSPPVDLGTLGGTASLAFGISRDGRHIVGTTHNAAQQSRAFIWSADAGMQDIGSLPAMAESTALAISADGEAVVGYSAQRIENWFAPNVEMAAKGFIWHRASKRMLELVNTLGGTLTLPFGVANGGSTVVGLATDSHGVPVAFRWTPSEGMTAATTLPAEQQMEVAKAVTSDGRISIGRLARNDEAFRAYWH
jgi:probable HAF family extracellular repeat protein